MEDLSQYADGVCHVHFLTSGDKEDRKIYYCKKCDAWICNECRPNKLLRAEAMAIALIKKAKGEITDGFSMFEVKYKGEIINKLNK